MSLLIINLSTPQLVRKPAEVFFVVQCAMSQTVLFIDGENFIHKFESVLKDKSKKRKDIDLATVDFNAIFEKPLKGIHLHRKIFYAAKLHKHEDTKEKSADLIKFQRKLRNSLVAQGYEFIMSGNVRGQKVGKKIIFKEKGVDVRIAVDLVSLACDKKLKRAILCSSDSDLQPAIKEVRARDVEVIYLGFEMSPNKGLTFTTNRTILFRNAEILEEVKTG